MWFEIRFFHKVYPKKNPSKMNEDDRNDLRSRLLNKEKEEIRRRDPTAVIVYLFFLCAVDFFIFYDFWMIFFFEKYRRKLKIIVL